MNASERLNVLILAPGCDGTDVGESWSSFQWVKGLSQQCKVTLLTLHRPDRPRVAEQLPSDVEVVEWEDWAFAGRFERFNSMFKPGYLRFYRNAGHWIRAAKRAGRRFDLIHQLGPLALRYPCPGTGSGLPIVIGPVAGSLETPAAFQTECESAPWYTKLRKIDRFRLRFDPWLRHSYQSADVVIGVAPYVADLLKTLPIKRFELASETGVHDVPDAVAMKSPGRDTLRLLYVGRVIRSKGLRDVVRSMGLLRDLPGIHLYAAGDGEDLPACREEARSLGISDRITFLGRVPRDQVESLYRQCDAFVFPSFREPSGNVVFEAMRWGLPVITTNRGGPAFVVDDHSGVRLAADNPSQLATDLAATIRRLAGNPVFLSRISKGARARIADVGLWSHKIDRMMQLYRRVVANAKQQPSNVL